MILAVCPCVFTLSKFKNVFAPESSARRSLLKAVASLSFRESRAVSAVGFSQLQEQHRQCSRLGGDFRWPTACSHDTFHLGRRVVCVCGELSHTLPRGTVAWAEIGGPGLQAGEFLLSASCEAEGSGEWGEGGHIGLFPPAMFHLKRGNQSAQPLLDQVFASIDVHARTGSEASGQGRNEISRLWV